MECKIRKLFTNSGSYF